MKFDTIIIGGGLSGLTAGIALAKAGQKCLLIAAGQSALHFFNGSFELLNGANPISAISQLDARHPYAKIGAEKVAQLAGEVPAMLSEMGIDTTGEATANHLRITPVGMLKHAWLTLSEMATLPMQQPSPYANVQIISLRGFLDFNASFVASNLARHGITATIAEVNTPALENLRRNPSEMRATNIAKALTGNAFNEFICQVSSIIDANADAIFLPAVFGIDNSEVCKALQQAISKPVKLIATMPPSVPGIRLQSTLRRHFQQLGGTILTSDSVVGAKFEGNLLTGVYTENHGDRLFLADNFILATGNFITHGLASTRQGVVEPALGVDIDSTPERAQWTTDNIFADQPFMSFGVATDAALHPMKNGQVVSNLYATGNVLSAFNAVKQGCTTGVSLITGLFAAQQIIK